MKKSYDKINIKISTMDLSQEILLIKLIDRCRSLMKRLVIQHKSLRRRLFHLVLELWIPIKFYGKTLIDYIPQQMRRVTQTIPEKKRVERDLLKCSLAMIECKARMIGFRRNLSDTKSDVANKIATYM